MAINANHIEVMNEQQNNLRLTEDQIIAIEKFWKDHRHNELEARNHIIASFCPQIYGLYPIKLAVCLVLCGGIERKDPNGTRNRGDSHILLVGDPGTGKSQILRYAAKLTPKSVMTSGLVNSILFNIITWYFESNHCLFRHWIYKCWFDCVCNEGRKPMGA